MKNIFVLKEVKDQSNKFIRDKDMTYLQDYSKQIEIRALEAD